MLDVREKDGYTIVQTIFYPNDQLKFQQISCYTYMAFQENPFWGGEATLETIANQIAHARGPSGTNREYLFNLTEAVRKITSIKDEHLETLERLVKEFLLNK